MDREIYRGKSFFEKAKPLIKILFFPVYVLLMILTYLIAKRMKHRKNKYQGENIRNTGLKALRKMLTPRNVMQRMPIMSRFKK